MEQLAFPEGIIPAVESVASKEESRSEKTLTFRNQVEQVDSSSFRSRQDANRNVRLKTQLARALEMLYRFDSSVHDPDVLRGLSVAVDQFVRGGPPGAPRAGASYNRSAEDGAPSGIPKRGDKSSVRRARRNIEQRRNK